MACWRAAAGEGFGGCCEWQRCYVGAWFSGCRYGFGTVGGVLCQPVSSCPRVRRCGQGLRSLSEQAARQDAGCFDRDNGLHTGTALAPDDRRSGGRHAVMAVSIPGALALLGRYKYRKALHAGPAKEPNPRQQDIADSGAGVIIVANPVSSPVANQ